jgi:hypothetical protein
VTASTQLELVPCEYIPKEMSDGKLYYSEKYGTAIHRCACGCGIQTVTPIHPITGWTIAIEGDKATLRPSIGNQQFPCKSHYWVTDGNIQHC